MTPRHGLLALTLIALGCAAACGFTVDPDRDRFACANDGECGAGYECRPQLAGGGLCYPVGQCVAEACDTLDNDCDGVADDDFALQTSNENCGTCGNVCAAGTRCQAARCAEATCGDGADNDGDGTADCADTDCEAKTCAADKVCAGGACPP
ncbi:MAG TPA: hypothetical protein VK447_06205 [Myxococcaceae bacterium]|nr:hypothetical protein [Myxococcaceae bacterium]